MNRTTSHRLKLSCSLRSGRLFFSAAWHDASAVTHPQQLLVLLLQLAFQVPHSLLDAPVALLRLQMDRSADGTQSGGEKKKRGGPDEGRV